ncbi:hypothetical protein J6590_027365 [Homalodisca vitripennis]|nr:hypothetical protein J6590_027365 [Homalodisca vitripennis]
MLVKCDAEKSNLNDDNDSRVSENPRSSLRDFPQVIIPYCNSSTETLDALEGVPGPPRSLSSALGAPDGSTAAIVFALESAREPACGSDRGLVRACDIAFRNYGRILVSSYMRLVSVMTDFECQQD